VRGNTCSLARSFDFAVGARFGAPAHKFEARLFEWDSKKTQHVLLVVFFATIIRSTFGFGEALIAVPLLALTIPIEIAAPVAVR
jgi:hypothetical protein